MSGTANDRVRHLIGQMRTEADAALEVIEFLEAVTEVLWAVHGEAIRRQRFEDEAASGWDRAQQRLAFGDEEEEDEAPF